MLENKITEDYKQAMKAKDAVKSSTLSFLRSQLKNVMIDKKSEALDDADVTAVIKKQIKQRQDSIAQFEKGGRSDLVEKEKAELAVLKSYLPQEIPVDELKKMIQEAIGESAASSLKDMGKVMKAVTPKVAGRADGKLLSDLVKEALSKM